MQLNFLSVLVVFLFLNCCHSFGRARSTECVPTPPSVVSFYSPNATAREFWLLHNLANTYIICIFNFSHSVGHTVTMALIAFPW